METTYQLPDDNACLLVAIKLANKSLARHGRPLLTQEQENMLRNEQSCFALMDWLEDLAWTYAPDVRALMVEAYCLAQGEITVLEAEFIYRYL